MSAELHCCSVNGPLQFISKMVRAYSENAWDSKLRIYRRISRLATAITLLGGPVGLGGARSEVATRSLSTFSYY